LTDKKIKHDSEVYISWTFLELEFKLAILKNKCTWNISNLMAKFILKYDIR